MDQVIISPIKDAMSHNMECLRCSVCCIDSFFLRLLHFLNDNLFVGKFNIGDSFTGSNAALGFACKKGRLRTFTRYRANLPRFNNRRKNHRQFAIVKLAHRSVASLLEAH